MAGAVSGIPRLTLVTVVLAIAITVAFHWIYPGVDVTKGLQLEFALIAFLGALAAEALLQVAARRRNRPPSAAAARPIDEHEETP